MMRRAFAWWFVLPGTVLCAVFALLHVPIPAERLAFDRQTSVTVLDRHGVALREVASEDHGFARWASLADISPHVIDATIAVEDRRFRRHFGFDPLAIARAAMQNIRAGRVVSGGSTITQQVVRNIYPIPKSFGGKLTEIWLAMRFEVTLSKDQILEQYLNRVPYGNRAFGVETAASTYFDKPAADLTVGEAAMLAGLPQAPSVHDPIRHEERARSRRETVLRAMRDCGFVTSDQLDRELAAPPRLLPARRAFRAPHFVRHVLSLEPTSCAQSEIRTTLDMETQDMVDAVLRGHVLALGGEHVTNAAALVLDTKTCEVLAWVGSADFLNDEIDGQVDGVLALRQPGSTLKPFTYGIALERGMTAATVLPDIPTYIPCIVGDYLPRNYDGTFHGPVRVRQALACSYNVPAVQALTMVDGPAELLGSLHDAGFSSLDRPPTHYGVGLTLGGCEVTLLELTRAYAAIARGGTLLPEVTESESFAAESQSPEHSPGEGGRIFSQAVSYVIADILSDDGARVPAFGEGGSLVFAFDCAAKTGTSKDYRDSWCVGFTTGYTVGVWVGNFDGRPTAGVSGARGAALIFRDVMLALHRHENPEPFKKTVGIETARICALSGLEAGPYCQHVIEEVFLDGTEPERTCDWHHLSDDGTVVVIDYPPKYRVWAERQGAARVGFTARAEPFFELSREAEFSPEHSSGYTQTAPLPSSRVYTDSTRLSIAFPDEGDVFAIDPVLRPEFQTVSLEAVVPRDIELLTWILDGAVVASVDAPFGFSWQLEQGDHTLCAEGRLPDGSAVSCDSVRFVVSEVGRRVQ